MELLLDDLKFPEGFAGLRDRLILELFYSTGMRLSELTGLKDENTDLAKGTIKVTGKRNKERIIPFSGRMASMIEGYMKEKKRTFPGASHQYLIVTDSGKPAYARMIYRIVNNYLKAVTTIQKKSPHILRHTFATHMLNKGADLNAIKEILGHASLAATQVYTHNTIEKLKTIYKQAHPKA
jgi:integrase/recombinase XerC